MEAASGVRVAAEVMSSDANHANDESTANREGNNGSNDALENQSQDGSSKQAAEAEQMGHQLWIAEVEDDSSSEASDELSVASNYNATVTEEDGKSEGSNSEDHTGVENSGDIGENQATSNLATDENDGETPLSRAMAKAVQEVESGQIEEHHQPIAAPAMVESFITIVGRPNESTSQITVTTTPQSTFDDNETAAGTFGIEYRPFKQEKTYSVPSGPVFEDEEEFTMDLASSALVASNNINPNDAQENGDDDEFEATVEPADFPPLLQSRTSQAADAGLMDDATEIFIEAAAVNEEHARVKENESLEIVVPDTVSLTDQARTALEDIAGIYASGLGDVGVRELGDPTVNGAEVEALHVGKVSVIMEEDEEESDDESDQKEEMLKLQEQQQLENEWQQTTKASTTSIPQQGSPLQQPRQQVQMDIHQLMPFADALQWIRRTDLAAHRDKIVVEESAGLMQKMMTSKLRFPGCEAELELPFLIACVPYDAAISQHKLILETIFSRLTGSTDPVPDIGPHWEQIGFQGVDPVTDLNRTMGLLSLLQMLSFLEEDRPLATQLYRISQIADKLVSIGADSSWPFICVSVGLTVDVVRVLRSGKLNSECNQQQQVLSVVNELHRATFFRLYTLLRLEEVSHISLRLQQLRKEVQSKPSKLLADYRSRAIHAQSQPTNSSRAEPQQQEAAVEEFTTLEEVKQQEDTESSRNWFHRNKADKFRVK